MRYFIYVALAGLVVRMMVVAYRGRIWELERSIEIMRERERARIFGVDQ